MTDTPSPVVPNLTSGSSRPRPIRGGGNSRPSPRDNTITPTAPVTSTGTGVKLSPAERAQRLVDNQLNSAASSTASRVARAGSGERQAIASSPCDASVLQSPRIRTQSLAKSDQGSGPSDDQIGTPESLHVVTVPDDKTCMRVSWRPPKGRESDAGITYRVLRSEHFDFDDAVVIAQTKSTTIIADGLNPESFYYFRVSAKVEQTGFGEPTTFGWSNRATGQFIETPMPQRTQKRSGSPEPLSHNLESSTDYQEGSTNDTTVHDSRTDRSVSLEETSVDQTHNTSVSQAESRTAPTFIPIYNVSLQDGRRRLNTSGQSQQSQQGQVSQRASTEQVHVHHDELSPIPRVDLSPGSRASRPPESTQSEPDVHQALSEANRRCRQLEAEVERLQEENENHRDHADRRVAEMIAEEKNASEGLRQELALLKQSNQVLYNETVAETPAELLADFQRVRIDNQTLTQQRDQLLAQVKQLTRQCEDLSSQLLDAQRQVASARTDGIATAQHVALMDIEQSSMGALIEKATAERRRLLTMLQESQSECSTLKRTIRRLQGSLGSMQGSPGQATGTDGEAAELRQLEHQVQSFADEVEEEASLQRKVHILSREIQDLRVENERLLDESTQFKLKLLHCQADMSRHAEEQRRQVEERHERDRERWQAEIERDRIEHEKKVSDLENAYQAESHQRRSQAVAYQQKLDRLENERFALQTQGSHHQEDLQRMIQGLLEEKQALMQSQEDLTNQVARLQSQLNLATHQIEDNTHQSSAQRRESERLRAQEKRQLTQDLEERVSDMKREFDREMKAMEHIHRNELQGLRRDLEDEKTYAGDQTDKLEKLQHDYKVLENLLQKHRKRSRQLEIAAMKDAAYDDIEQAGRQPHRRRDVDETRDTVVVVDLDYDDHTLSSRSYQEGGSDEDRDYRPRHRSSYDRDITRRRRSHEAGRARRSNGHRGQRHAQYSDDEQGYEENVHAQNDNGRNGNGDDDDDDDDDDEDARRDHNAARARRQRSESLSQANRIARSYQASLHAAEQRDREALRSPSVPHSARTSSHATVTRTASAGSPSTTGIFDRLREENNAILLGKIQEFKQRSVTTASSSLSHSTIPVSVNERKSPVTHQPQHHQQQQQYVVGDDMGRDPGVSHPPQVGHAEALRRANAHPGTPGFNREPPHLRSSVSPREARRSSGDANIFAARTRQYSPVMHSHPIGAGASRPSHGGAGEMERPGTAATRTLGRPGQGGWAKRTEKPRWK